MHFAKCHVLRFSAFYRAISCFVIQSQELTSPCRGNIEALETLQIEKRKKKEQWLCVSEAETMLVPYLTNLERVQVIWALAKSASKEGLELVVYLVCTILQYQDEEGLDVEKHPFCVGKT
jgi:hypothetical protein